MSVLDDILAELRAIRAALPGDVAADRKTRFYDVVADRMRTCGHAHATPGEAMQCKRRQDAVSARLAQPEQPEPESLWRATGTGTIEPVMAGPLHVWSCGHAHPTRGEAVTCLRQLRAGRADDNRPKNADEHGSLKPRIIEIAQKAAELLAEYRSSKVMETASRLSGMTVGSCDSRFAPLLRGRFGMVYLTKEELEGPVPMHLLRPLAASMAAVIPDDVEFAEMEIPQGLHAGALAWGSGVCVRALISVDMPADRAAAGAWSELKKYYDVDHDEIRTGLCCIALRLDVAPIPRSSRKERAEDDLRPAYADAAVYD